MRALLLTVALSACVPGPAGQLRPLTAAEVVAVADAEQTWAASEAEPIGETCDEARPRMRVAIARTHAEMFNLTGYCGPSAAPDDGTACRWGRANGAYRRARDGGVWPFALFGAWYPLIVMWHEAASPRLVRHESKHWIGGCAANDLDHDHSREVW